MPSLLPVPARVVRRVLPVPLGGVEQPPCFTGRVGAEAGRTGEPGAGQGAGQAADRAVPGWDAVLPVKLLAVAKSRLASYGDTGRSELALAFADDVVTAVLASGLVDRVVVVTDDARAAAALARTGTCVVADLPEAALNSALVRGAELLREADPGRGVVALTSDLPALRPGDLDEVLVRVRGRAFVSDTEGVGTTLLAAAPGHALGPVFGPDSARRHRASGARELPAPASLRRDVDTPQDLHDALRLGVGPRTAAVAAWLHAEAG